MSYTLMQYGGVLQTMLATLSVAQQQKTDLEVTYQSIPLNAFVEYFKSSPLPPITDGGTKVVGRANEVIEFINRTDDIVNLRRALNVLSELCGASIRPFPDNQYAPELLNFEEFAD